MHGKDETAFLRLRAKFVAETEKIEQKIEELVARRDELINLLDGTVFEEIVEEEPPTDKLDQDHALSEFIRKNQPVKRPEINAFFEGQNLSSDQIRRALERCKRRGLITVEGRSKSAVWTAVE